MISFFVSRRSAHFFSYSTGKIAPLAFRVTFGDNAMAPLFVGGVAPAALGGFHGADRFCDSLRYLLASHAFRLVFFYVGLAIPLESQWRCFLRGPPFTGAANSFLLS